MSINQAKKFRYIRGLDGLRALAVLSVIAYHLNIPYTTGGFLGVTVFFVLSGYLITSLLVAEWDNTQNIDLKNFWIRRAKRLLPAMFFLLIVLNIFVPLIRPELVQNLWKDTIAATFYYSNWHYVFQDLSYFESFETVSLLTHFWSLAIEEQFYIVWAIIIFMAFKYSKSSKAILWCTIVVAIFSTISMMVMYEPNTDPSRIYYGTDTRMFSLLIGAVFALILPSHRLKDTKRPMIKWAFELLGIIGLLVFILMTMFSNQYQSFIYQGGMLLVSIATAMLILSLASPSTKIVVTLLELKPLKWIGERSYGIYLWQYPVIMLMKPEVSTSGIDYIHIIMQVIIILMMASLSYVLIENPIRKGEFHFGLKSSAAVTVMSISLVFTANVLAHPVESDNEAIKEVVVEKKDSQKNVVVLAKGKDKSEQTKPEQIVTTEKITAIGDSVLINPAPFLKEKFPNIEIHAKVGRQMWDAPAIVDELKGKNQLAETVLIVLGSNGAYSKESFDMLMENIGEDKEVIFMNVRVPKPWESIVNKDLERAMKEYPNAKVINWFEASKNHDEYFVDDGVHLESEGVIAFTKLIADTVREKNIK